MLNIVTYVKTFEQSNGNRTYKHSGVSAIELAKRVMGLAKEPESLTELASTLDINDNDVKNHYIYLCRTVTRFNKLAGLLINYLRERGATSEEVKTVLTILKKYEE